MNIVDAELAEFHRAWHNLWEVAEFAASSAESDPRWVFESIGLLLEPPGEPASYDYDATPEGAQVFASTGGDGVHFSAVRSAQWLVIVMTVPMMFERPNIVLGRDLPEFLALGCRYGYFELEQLAYQRDRAIDEIQEGRDDDADGYLTVLRQRLGLRPWHDVRYRLGELAEYGPAR
jgi:hypothetical protein